MASKGNGVWWRRIRLVITSVLIWHIALRIAINSWPYTKLGILSCSSAGVLGALMICVACRFIIPQKYSLMQIMMSSLAGVVGGAAIGSVFEVWAVSRIGAVGSHDVLTDRTQSGNEQSQFIVARRAIVTLKLKSPLFHSIDCVQYRKGRARGLAKLFLEIRIGRRRLSSCDRFMRCEDDSPALGCDRVRPKGGRHQ